MKLGRAFTITEAALLASNVTETETLFSLVVSYAAAVAVYEVVDGVHQRFVSVHAANLGNLPSADTGANWTAEGATNRWRAFDQRQQLQTSRADSIVTQIQVSGRIDTVFVANVSGQEMQVTCTDAVDGLVYDTTVSLVSTSRITDWARWFREPIRRLKDKGLTDLPSGYSDLIVEITVSAPGEDVLIGEIVLAHMAEIGGTQWGAGLGNRSYTRIEEDAFGTDFIVRRGTKRTGDYGVIVDNRDLDDVTTLLDDADGRAVLFVGSSDYSAMFIFGLLLEWKELVNWPDRTALTLNIQGFVR